jgi:cysteinyl-tRNA synthetase
MSTSTTTENSTSTMSSQPNIQVYNTLTRTKLPFETVTPGKVGMYLCGPTVYKPSHIGHMVGPVIFDCIKRYLEYSGYEVTFVINITDVDDKLIAESNSRGIPMADVATEMTADYVENLEALGVTQVDKMPKATEHMTDILDFISKLIDKGCAYASEGDVYFEVGKDEDYGKLTNRSVDDSQGEGGEMASRKRSPGDFALWKSSKPGEPSWESPWGNGRPGWHIECSAMSHAILGETFDIHGGGLDLVFPHHENEIAQSESCHDAPMAKYWMHNGLMRASSAAGKVGGKGDRAATEEQATVDTKISRSKGGGGLAELIAEHSGERIRFFLLRTHYRSTIVFGDEGLQEAGTALDSFHRFFERFERITGQAFYGLAAASTRTTGNVDSNDSALMKEVAERRTNFLTKMDDDFNTGAAMSEMFDLLRSLNRFADKNNLEDTAARSDATLSEFQQAATTLKELSAILGLFEAAPVRSSSADSQVMDPLMQLVIDLRTAARENKDFATSDKVRDDLATAGIVIEDRSGTTTWRQESGDAPVDQIMQLLIDIRASARENKDFATSDKVRDDLATAGIVIEDRSGDTTWRREA